MPACSVVITVMWGCHLCLNVRALLSVCNILILRTRIQTEKKDVGVSCFFFLTAESKPHGLALQEDIWDADVDLHQKLLRRWKELKDRSGHK